MGNISTLIDKNGNQIIPRTTPEAVQINDSKTLKEFLGTTDISSVGDGTVTGAIVKNGSDIGQVIQQITDKKSALLVDLNPEIKFNGNQSARKYGLVKSVTISIEPTDINVDGWSNVYIAKLPQDYVPSFNITNNYVDSAGKVFKLTISTNGEIGMQVLGSAINKINFLFINECYI